MEVTVLVPTVIESTNRGERAYDIYSRLLANRIVFLGTAIDDQVSNLVIAQLLHLESESTERDVATICVGQAASAAAVLLAAGAKGKRLALPHARILLHQPWGSGGGQATDIEIQAREILRMKDLLNQILADHTGQPLEKIERDTDRDFVLEADAAKEYGIIDEVISARELADNSGPIQALR